jgi:hypothetical protein
MSIKLSVFSIFPALLFVLLAAFVLPLQAQESYDGDEEDALTFEQRLVNLTKTLDDKEKERAVLKRKLENPKDNINTLQLQQELSSAEDIILGVRSEIVELSTGGAKLFIDPPVEKKEFNWKKDLEQIFEPLLNQMREITERPRQLEQLQADIAFWDDRRSELARAVKNIQANLELVNNADVKAALNDLLNTALSREKSANQKLSLLRNDLRQFQKADNPLWSKLGDIFTDIIVAMILHFFLAVGAAFAMYQTIRLLSLLPIKILNRKKIAGTIFAERAVVISRIVMGSILAVMTYFVILYSFSEWLLLVLSLLLIAGIVIGLKSAVPAYFLEIKTLLNMGSIRQGERLMFNGLPWRINRLNMYTHLHNPALQGHFRVPLSEIIHMSSRLAHDDEAWFPTNTGDIVFLEDEVFGRVIRQTPEIVEVDLGGSIYSYQTTEFLSRRPRNLSREGFTVYEVFGLDYQHQSEITTSILTTYTQAITAALGASAFAEFNTYLGVEFDNASTSSLDFKIIASFSGEAAADYYKIRRLLQKTSVETANQQGWVIPFQQMTVHYQPVT